MKRCFFCGSKEPDGAFSCLACGLPVGGFSAGRGKKTVVEINIKAGLPTVDRALLLLKQKLRDARCQGAKAVKVVHGYGSTGCGGSIRIAARKELQRMVNAGEIELFLNGEDYDPREPQGRALISRFGSLAHTQRQDTRNAGMTIVVF